MAWWWYLIPAIINFIRADIPFGGGGFLPDPFLELTAGGTTPPNEKSHKTDSTCVSHGALAGSIIGTLILSAFIGFLAWFIYFRQKLQDAQLYKDHEQLSLQYQGSISTFSKREQSKAKQYADKDPGDLTCSHSQMDIPDPKFGTFPFRQSQTPTILGQNNHSAWLNRLPSSFRSENMENDSQTIDIELLNPTFCGLNFSITGNMRAGIFIKDILDKEYSEREVKLNTSDKLRTGDRIIALTICFESIVYEDALTILSYASPYPVILRVQRPLHSPKISVQTEKRPTTSSTNKVKWRDDFEHYDNDTPIHCSINQQDPSTTINTETKSFPSKTQSNVPTKKARTQPPRNKSSTSKGNKVKRISNTVGATAKHSDTVVKVHPDKTSSKMILAATGLSAKPIDKTTTPPMPTTKSAVKSVTNAVISYLHYRDTPNNSEGALMPYYDSPYDYYGPPVSHTTLNKNNNNSVSTESLNAAKSVYTIQLSNTKSNSSIKRAVIPRRCQRRLSSPGAILPMTIKPNEKLDAKQKTSDTIV